MIHFKTSWTTSKPWWTTSETSWTTSKTSWTTSKTSRNTLKILWNIMKQSNTRHSIQQYRRSMQTRRLSAQRYPRSCGVFGNIADCSVGVTPQMCNRVTNFGDMCTFSRPVSKTPIVTYATEWPPITIMPQGSAILPRRWSHAKLYPEWRLE